MNSTEIETAKNAGKAAIDAFQYIYEIFKSVDKLLKEIDKEFENPIDSEGFVNPTKGQHLVWYASKDIYGWVPSSFFRVFTNERYPDRLFTVELHFNKDYLGDDQPKIVYGRHDYEPGKLPTKFENWWLNNRRWATETNNKENFAFYISEKDGYRFSTKTGKNDRPQHHNFRGGIFKSESLFLVKGKGLKKMIVKEFEELNKLEINQDK